MARRTPVALFAAAGAAACLTTPSFAVEFSTLLLPLPTGKNVAEPAVSDCINDAGQVAYRAGLTTPGRLSAIVRHTPGQAPLVLNPDDASDSVIQAIGSAGQLFGYRNMGATSSKVLWRYTDGAPLEMVTDNSIAFTFQYGGMNAAGVVVGHYRDLLPEPHFVPARWTPGQPLEPLASIDPQLATMDRAMDINNDGAILAIADGANNEAVSFIYKPGSGLTDVGNLGVNYVLMTGLNDAGMAIGGAGSVVTPTGGDPVLYEPLTGLRTIPMPPGAVEAAPQLLSQNGLVAGTYRRETGELAVFLHDAATGVTTPLAPSSLAPSGSLLRGVRITGLNVQGSIVGSLSYDPDPLSEEIPTAHVGWIWTPAGGLEDLQAKVDPTGETYDVESADGINASGQVVVTAVRFGVRQRVLLLTPVASGACCTGTECAVVANPGDCAGSFRGVGSACTGDDLNPVTCCAANFDQQNGVQVADIFAFLRAWFANQPSADFDQQNGIQVADIFSFLRSWFAGC